MQKQQRPFVLIEPQLWFILTLLEAARWIAGWFGDWGFSQQAFNLYLTLFIVLGRMTWERNNKSLNISQFFSQN